MLIVLLINDAIENSKILCYLIVCCSFPKAFPNSMPQYNASIQPTSHGFTLGSLRFATRGLKTAYRSLDASAVKGIPL